MGNKTFDRVFVINSDDKPERYAAFVNRLPSDWPFPTPIRVPSATPSAVPSDWIYPRSAWSCLITHFSILKFIGEHCHQGLILEDDAVWCEGFSDKATTFLRSVPDYDGLWIGGEHVEPPTKIRNGVVRCNRTIRAHCYAVTADYARRMVDLINKKHLIAHVDQIFAWDHKNSLCLAPERFLSGQAAGISSIDGQVWPERYWN